MTDTNTGDTGNATAFPAKWNEVVGSFATALGLDLKLLTAKLASLVGEPSDDALETLGNAEYVSDDDIQKAVDALKANVPIGLLRKNLAMLRAACAPKVQPRIEPSTEHARSAVSLDILPSVPEDDVDFLAMLKVGGELKVDKRAVLSALRAGMADRLGLFNLPEKVLELMEKRAEELDEPCGEEFYEVERLVTERSYADVLSVLNVKARLVTKGRKDRLIERINSRMWDALYAFHEQLKGWQEAWLQGAANPAMMMQALLMSQAGGVMPPGMMSPPETKTVRDAAEAFINHVNGIFAGTGIPVAVALAYDATRINTVLTDPRVPRAVGATTRDEMLRKLGVNVGADVVRLERNVARYAMGVMELPKQAEGTAEYAYLGALLQLGVAIPWDTLKGSGVVAGNGDRPPRARRERYNDPEPTTPSRPPWRE